ncbi:ArnT family glycosyltransferase [Leptothrix discophora]|uniref:Glycosyltransferase family 39 protein n=1 Tax=Leptothrix discophora TaxID=89 RepID=A0ABT9G6R6_LEPDI|nr:glycosyltransferase family 39 protein [Leptothrix discophora]MDP4302100.1 glycosyltransferase family 39 protein [Leptothrix discophora]
MSRAHRRVFLVWALAALALQLFGLGTLPLFDVDEGAFSEATRELLSSGDWGHTTLNGEDRFDKPILVYWLQAASAALFGLDEFAVRLPSALAAWLWAVFVAHVVAHRMSPPGGTPDLRAGLAAGSVLLTSLGVALIGRAATADALLNLWLALATLSLWTALRDLAPGLDDTRQRSGRRALRLAALWIALGLLTKGPVAVLVPGAAVGLWCLSAGWMDRPDDRSTGHRAGIAARAWQRLRPLLSDAWAWAVLVGVAAPWYAYALHRHGMAFVDGFLWRHNLQRYGGTLEGHGGAWFYYLLLLPLLMLPWSALLVPVLARLRTRWRDPAERYLLLWAGFVLVFFSASGTKLPHYVLYGLTPLAILAGRALTEPAVPAETRSQRIGQAGLALGFLLLPLGVLWASDLAQGHIAASTRPAEALHALLLAGPGLLSGEAGRTLAIGAAVLGLLLGGASWAGRRSPLRPAAPLLAAALLVLGLTQLLLPWWAERLQGPVKTLAGIARTQQPGRVAVQWGLHQPSFAFYLGQPAPRRAPEAGELALVRADRLDALQAEPGLHVIARAPGYLLIGRDAP